MPGILDCSLRFIDIKKISVSRSPRLYGRLLLVPRDADQTLKHAPDAAETRPAPSGKAHVRRLRPSGTTRQRSVTCCWCVPLVTLVTTADLAYVCLESRLRSPRLYSRFKLLLVRRTHQQHRFVRAASEAARPGPSRKAHNSVADHRPNRRSSA